MIDEVNAAARLIAAYLTCPLPPAVTSQTTPQSSLSSLSPPPLASSPNLNCLPLSQKEDKVVTSALLTKHDNNLQLQDKINNKNNSSGSFKEKTSCPEHRKLGGKSEKQRQQLASSIQSWVGVTVGGAIKKEDEKDGSESGGGGGAEEQDAEDSLTDDDVDSDVTDQRRSGSRQCDLMDSISTALQAKFHGHWYPSLPSKGSGYRCLKFGAQYLDGAIVSACECCGIDRAEIITSIPNDLILWIDPGEVSYKIGDSVPLTTVYSKQQGDSDCVSGSVEAGIENGCVGSNLLLLRNSEDNATCKVTPPTLDDSSSPVPGAARDASPFLGPGLTGVLSMQGGLSSPMYSQLEGASDLNNNNINICQHLPPPPPNPQALAAAAALCNFNKTLMMTSQQQQQQPFVSSASGSSNCMNMNMDTICSSHAPNIQGCVGSPFKAANKIIHPSYVNSNTVGVMNGVGVGGLHPAGTTDLSSPSPPVNGFTMEEMHHSQSPCGDGVPMGGLGLGMGVGVVGPPPPHLGAVGGGSNGLGFGAFYGTGPAGGVHGRPTTLPGVGMGVVSKNSQYALNHHQAPISNNSTGTAGQLPNSLQNRNHHVPRNLAGSHWAKRGGRFGAGNTIPHSLHSFTSLNPEAAIFSPTDSPEQQLTNTFVASLPPPSQIVAAAGSMGCEYSNGVGTVTGRSFHEDSPSRLPVSPSNIHYSASSAAAAAPGFMSPSLSAKGAPATSLNGATTGGGGPPCYNRIMGGGSNNNNNHQQQQNSSCGSTSHQQQTTFQVAAAAVAINQLQFHQQAFRGGSPVDYAPFYSNNNNRSSSSSSLMKNNNVNVLSSVSPNNNTSQSPIHSQMTSSASSVSNGGASGGGGGVSPSSSSSVSVVVTTNGGSPSPPTGNVTSAGGPLQTPSSKNNNSHSTNGIMSPSTSTSGGPSATTSAANNVNSSPLTSNQGGGGGGANQQLMTADAFAATKFGSTKLKSRKSNINLSQMSPTQFEAYMRHKTSTMHSRPPHTNYTDAYPASSSSSSSHFGGPVGANSIAVPTGASIHSLQNAAAGGNSAACYFGPIRAGSSGSSTSTPSPCGSFPGFPSPSMVMDPGGLPSRCSAPVSAGGACGNPIGHRAGGLHSHNFEQAMHDFCDDPFFQPSGGNTPYQMPPPPKPNSAVSQHVNGGSTCNNSGLGAISNSQNSSHNHFLHLDAVSVASLTPSPAAIASGGAGLGPIGGVVNNRGAVSRAGGPAGAGAELNGWNGLCGIGMGAALSDRMPPNNRGVLPHPSSGNGLMPPGNSSSCRFDQQQQFNAAPPPSGASFPGVIGSPGCSASVGGGDNTKTGAPNSKKTPSAPDTANNNSMSASSCAISPASTVTTSTAINSISNNLVSGGSSSNMSHIAAGQHPKVTSAFMKPFPNITQASRVGAN